MDKEVMDALRELFSKIPKEDIDEAVKTLSDDQMEQLSGGGLWDYLKSLFGQGKSSDHNNLSPASAPASVRVKKVYTSKEEIRRDYLAGKIKGLRNLRNAYKSLNPSFKGTLQDVLTILNL